MNKKKQHKPYLFVQRFCEDKDDVLVFVGCPDSETASKLAKKALTDKTLAENLKDIEHHWDVDGSVQKLKNDKTGKVAFIMSLKPFRDEWDWYCTLIHELHHLVFFAVQEGRNAWKEMEFLAYTQENLFNQIRSKIAGEMKFTKWEL